MTETTIYVLMFSMLLFVGGFMFGLNVGRSKIRPQEGSHD